MMPVGVSDPSPPPAVLVIDGRNGFGAGRNSSGECAIGIFDDHDYSYGTAAKRLGTEVRVFRGLVGDPERCARNRKLGNHLTRTVLDLEQPFPADARFCRNGSLLCLA